MESSIGWIDLTQSDLNQARDYLRRLEEGTLDELGFGIIRDFFSEQFFPATSTVMTIARQYVLVPFSCLHLERRILNERGWDARRAHAELHDLENDLRKCVGDTQKPDVLRLPSTIYWPALRRLGVLTEGTLQSRFRRVTEAARGRYTDDDGMRHDGEDEEEFWDPELVRLYEREREDLFSKNRFTFADPLAKSLNATLTEAEARYLQSVYRRYQSKTKPSILSRLLDKEREPQFDWPWEADYPSELRETVSDAERFSMLVAGARLVYYQLLIEEWHVRRLVRQDPPRYATYFEAWWQRARDKIRGWDLDSFIGRIRPALRSFRKDREFLTDFQEHMRKLSTADQFFNSEAVQRMVRERELKVRPQKSRLRILKYLEQWKPVEYDYEDQDNDYGLDFRASIASKLCGEILNGLKRGNRHV